MPGSRARHSIDKGKLGTDPALEKLLVCPQWERTFTNSYHEHLPDTDYTQHKLVSEGLALSTPTVQTGCPGDSF